MKSRIVIFLLFIFFSTNSIFSQDVIICDFYENFNFQEFKYKDDKGSVITTFSKFIEKDTENRCLQIKYDIVKEGWAGWGLGLQGFNAKGYNYISLKVKGETGGEVFEVGIKSKANNIEKKLNIKSYIDITTDWQEVKIPFSDFVGVDFNSIDNINISFGDFSKKGVVYIDDIKFLIISEYKDSISAAKVLIEGFERTNPYDFYIIYQADESEIKLNSSRMSYVGDYAMEIEYKLLTSRPWGSWVSARAKFKPEFLNWAGTKEFKIYVYGDGTDNMFRLNIIDEDNEIWYYENKDILKSTKWTQLSMPIKDFKLSPNSPKGNGRLDLEKIRTWEIMIVSQVSGITPMAKTVSSKIYVDQLYLLGENIDSKAASPIGIVEELRIAVPQIGNVNFSGVVFTEYINTPEQKNRISHCGKLSTNASVKDISVRFELIGKWQEFGESAYYTATTTGTTIFTQDMYLDASALEVLVNNPLQNISYLKIGNVWIDYGPLVFAPVWGYKGLTLEGDVGRLNYNIFLIKGVYDSYSAGFRFNTFYKKYLLTIALVQAKDTAKVQGEGTTESSTLLGEIETSNYWQIKPISEDLVYILELKRKVFNENLKFTFTYGNDIYKKKAEADYTNPFFPVYTCSLYNPYETSGNLFRLKAESEGVLKGLSTSLEYRDVDPGFKPKYRQDPILFDENISDQKGYNFRISQWYKSFVFSYEYDDIIRKEFKDGFRYKNNYGIGYYGLPNMEIGVNRQEIREKNNTKSDRSSFSALNKNEKQIINELYIRTKIKDNIILLLQTLYMNGEWLNSGDSYSLDFFYSKLEYYFTTNAKFVLEYKTTNYPAAYWEQRGWPYTDNYLKGVFEVTF